MFVVSVAPIKRGIPIDELSYFTKDPIEPGALVSVPLRGRSVPGLVIRSIPAQEAKSELRQADFSLKKLERVRATNFFSPGFIRAAITTATYFAASPGAAIQALFPNALLTMKQSKDSIRAPKERRGQRYIFQAEEEERFATYKSHIREVFARGGSCFFVLPTLQDIESTFTKLEKGISNYTFILHSGLTKKEIEKRWNAILATDHPVLIIGTPLFLSIPRSDIESVILDKESASGYQLATRPYIDMRFYVEEFAKEVGADLIFGDLFLRVETIERYSRKEFEALLRPKSRVPSTASQHVIDMRASGEQPATGKVAICSAELVDLIEEVRKKGTHCFILGVRRGFAPMTVCGDCGTVVTCNRCAAPMVIHKRTGGAKTEDGEVEHIFLCHRCGLERETDVTCSHCGGWRLVPLGIGIAQAEESIRRRFPDATIFRIDRDTVERHGDAKKIIDKFYQTPGSILLGTEMAIPYLTEPIATVAVLSVNSLLTIPDFRMGEKVFRLLLVLREKAREHFLVQTRDPDMDLFELATAGNIGEFIRTELLARQELSYPPFSTMIKFTHQGGKVEGGRALEDIERIFGAYHPVTFPSFIGKVKGKYLMNALLRIPKQGDVSAWPNNELLGLIRALPPDVEVRVNPDSII
jgi:primosomal protein N' (replication factor Y)